MVKTPAGNERFFLLRSVRFDTTKIVLKLKLKIVLKKKENVGNIV